MQNGELPWILECWRRNKGVAVGLAFGFYAFVVLFSAITGQAFDDKVDGISFEGFWGDSNWSALYFIAMPLTAFVMAYFFDRIAIAIKSLDAIVVSVPAGDGYSIWAFATIRRNFSTWILPLVVLLTLGSVLAADFFDIISPLRYYEPSGELDWTTIGYHKTTLTRAETYGHLAFNLLAFSMEGILAFCAILAIALSAYPLFLFVNVTGSHVESDSPRKFKIEWDFCDDSGRCGLYAFDKMFMAMIMVMFISILVSIWSVSANLSGQSGTPAGTALLLIWNAIFALVAIFLVLFPYWRRFPGESPADLICPGPPPGPPCKPRPWPLGMHVALATGIASGYSVLWYYLLKIGEPALKEWLRLG